MTTPPKAKKKAAPNETAKLKAKLEEQKASMTNLQELVSKQVEAMTTMRAKIEAEFRDQIDAACEERNAAKAEIERLKAQVTELAEKLTKMTESKDTWYKSDQEKVAELEQLHLLLDGLPGAHPRKDPLKRNDYYAKNLSVQTRLTSWIACLAMLPLGVSMVEKPYNGREKED